VADRPTPPVAEGITSTTVPDVEGGRERNVRVPCFLASETVRIFVCLFCG
jgi:hypothetical protein